MLLPHESTVKHDGRPVTEEPRRGMRLANIDMGSSIEGVHRGRLSLLCAVLSLYILFLVYIIMTKNKK